MRQRYHYSNVFSGDEEITNLASLYAAGALGKAERAQLEKKMRQDAALRDYVLSLCDAATELALSETEHVLSPPESAREIIFSRIREIPIDILRAFDLRDDEGFVMTDTRGLIRWVNSEFTSMCGYELEELKGKKPGHILQGPATDPATVAKMRSAFHQLRSVNVEMLNYHKNGNPYWVSITMSPVMDEFGEARCFVAIEREIADRELPAMIA